MNRRRAAMIVTVSTFNETGAQLQEGVRHVKDEVVPSVRGAQGLQAGYWVIDLEHGQRLSILVWESADAASAAMPSVMATVKRRRGDGGPHSPQPPADQSCPVG